MKRPVALILEEIKYVPEVRLVERTLRPEFEGPDAEAHQGKTVE